MSADEMVSEGAPPVAGGATAAKCSGRRMARRFVAADSCRAPQKEKCMNLEVSL